MYLLVFEDDKVPKKSMFIVMQILNELENIHYQIFKLTIYTAGFIRQQNIEKYLVTIIRFGP